MNIGTFYPKNIGIYSGWVNSSGGPLASGDYVYINDSSDTTYIKKTTSDPLDCIDLYFNEPDLSNYFNTIDSAILRIRGKVEVDTVPDDHGIIGNNVFDFNTEHVRSPVTNILGAASLLSDSPSPVVPRINFSTIGGGSYAYYEYIGTNKVSNTSFTTYDFSLTLNTTNNNRHKTFCINHFKDSKITLTGPSGFYIADVELIITGDMSDGLLFNTLGGETHVVREQVTGKHLSNLRYWCRDEGQPHPTGFFSYYTDFVNNTPKNSWNWFQSLDHLDAAKNLTIYNPYTNSLPMMNASGFPVNYQGAIIVKGSGTNPGMYRLEDYTNTIQTCNAWTYYFSVMPETVNDINDTYRSILRYGGSTGWPSENYTFKITPTDGGHFLDYDYITFTYFDSTGSFKGKNLYSNGFKPFHNAVEPTKIIVSYSGEKLKRNDGLTTSSGTMKFYAASRDATDIHQSTYFRYLGEVSDAFYVYDRYYDSHSSILGTPQSGGGGYGSEGVTAGTILTELGIIQNAYYSGVKTVNGKTYLDSQNFNDLIHKRKIAHDYIQDSGDSKYVEITWPKLYTNSIADSGKRTELITLICKSGESNRYEMLIPFTTADGYIDIMENTARVDYSIDINTNHPSGIDTFFILEGDYDGQFGISFQTTLASGTHTGTLYNPIVYGLDKPKRMNFKESDDMTGPLHRFNFNVGFQTHPVPNETYETNIKVNSAKIFIDVVNIATTGTNNLPLYINSEGANEAVDLFIAGQAANNSDLDLYIRGSDVSSNSTTLYIKDASNFNDSITMFIDGIGIENTDIPMYIKSSPGVESSGDFSLYTLGTLHSGCVDNFTMYMESAETYRDRILPLVIHAKSINVNEDISLYIKSENEANKGFDMYTVGPDGSNDDVTFYIKAPGSTSGSIPHNDEISLFMARNSDSTDERLRLFIGGPNNVVQETPFYIYGAHIENSSINFVIEGSPIQDNKTTKFYTHGF